MLAQLEETSAVLMIVGGASGREGQAEVARITKMIDELGLSERVQFVDPQPHYALSTYYRAASVVVMPSRSESFGLVALEAAASGVPVVAASVGGLRTLVQDGVTGYLIEDRNPGDYASAVDRILGDQSLAAQLAAAAAVTASRYPWSGLATRLHRIYLEQIEVASLVEC